MTVFTEFAQYSPLYWEKKRGLPSTSNFHRILTPKTEKPSAQADAYIHELIGERLSMARDPFIGRSTTREMEEGLLMEPESRKWYAMEADCDVLEVGGCISDCGRFWCSPDGLVGDEGVLELKNPSAKVHIGYLMDGEVPSEHKAQVHGQLIVTGRAWVDYVSYHPGLAPLRLRIVPDEFTAKLRRALDAFHERYMALLRRVAPEAA